MIPHNRDDGVFSAGKPKKIPWFWFPVFLGVVALVVIYKWFL